MKPLLLAAMLLYAFLSFGQTYKQEIAWIKKQQAEEQLTSTQAAEYKQTLNRFVRDGLYPVLPYDTSTNEIVFDTILECPGISKAVIYNRIKEWCAIAYRDFDSAVRYENYESGKIIAKGYVQVNYIATYEGIVKQKHTSKTTTCDYSLVFIVKDNKLKISVQQLNYRSMVEGYMYFEAYIPPAQVEFSFSDLFPIVNHPPYERSGKLEPVRNTIKALDASTASLLRYVKAWQEDDKF